MLWWLSKQISKLFFQMSTQVYSPPGQAEGRRTAFLEWKTIDLNSIKNPLHVRVILNVIKVFLLVKIVNILEILIINQ